MANIEVTAAQLQASVIRTSKARLPVDATQTAAMGANVTDIQREVIGEMSSGLATPTFTKPIRPLIARRMMI
jgi:hypothetical protein